MADEMNGEREALQRALGVIERWARDAYVVCSKPATQEGFEAAWKAEDADAYEVWSAGRASLAENAGSEPNGYQKALDIRIQEGGWELSGSKVPVLYTDSINGRQVCRDDVWLCTTEAFTHPSPPEGMAGWKLVPIEPTPAMLAAVVTSMDDFLLGKEAEKQYREDWAAMLDAAPAAPSTPASGGATADEVLKLVDELFKVEAAKNHIHATYMGIAMPDAVYNRFKLLRDEQIPELRKKLRDMLPASPTIEGESNV